MKRDHLEKAGIGIGSDSGALDPLMLHCIPGLWVAMPWKGAILQSEKQIREIGGAVETVLLQSLGRGSPAGALDECAPAGAKSPASLHVLRDPDRIVSQGGQDE